MNTLEKNIFNAIASKLKAENTNPADFDKSINALSGCVRKTMLIKFYSEHYAKFAKLEQ